MFVHMRRIWHLENESRQSKKSTCVLAEKNNYTNVALPETFRKKEKNERLPGVEKSAAFFLSTWDWHLQEKKTSLRNIPFVNHDVAHAANDLLENEMKMKGSRNGARWSRVSATTREREEEHRGRVPKLKQETREG